MFTAVISSKIENENLRFLQWDCGHLVSFHFKKTLLMSFFLERYFQNLDLFCSIEKAESILDLI